MDVVDLNEVLFTKAKEELKGFSNWLLKQSPDVVLEHAFEYTTKADIVSILENTEFSEEEARALLTLEKPLDTIYKSYDSSSSNSMDVLVSFIEDKAHDLIAGNESISFMQTPPSSFAVAQMDVSPAGEHSLQQQYIPYSRMTPKEENIVNIAMRAAELLKDGKIERSDITGHAGLTDTIIGLAEAFEQQNAGVDFDAEGRDYWLEIDAFAEEHLLNEYRVHSEREEEPPMAFVDNSPVKVFAVSGSVRREVFSGDWDECAQFYDDHNGYFLDENEFEWGLEVEDEREASFPDGFFDAVDHYCELAGSNIENEFVHQHAEELTYCWENGLFLMDFEMWTGLEAILNEKITFEEASFLNGTLKGKIQDLPSNENTAAIDNLQSSLADFRSAAGKRLSLDSQISNAAQKVSGEPVGPRNLNEIHRNVRA